MRRMQHEVHFVPMSEAGVVERIRSINPDVVVVAKVLGGNDAVRFNAVASRVREGLRAAVADGRRVAVDFCDDHFNDAMLGPFWRDLASMADTCVAGSDELRETVQMHSTSPVQVIGDPIASPLGQPRVFRKQSRVHSRVQNWLGGTNFRQRLRMVWYGNAVNVEPLFKWAAALAPLAIEQPWWLSVVTDPLPQIESSIAQFNSTHAGKAVMELVPWTEEAQWTEIDNADLVLIPSDVSKAAKRAKTANRITDALHMGRFVVASPVPSYMPFAEFAATTADPLAAVRKYASYPDDALRHVRAGQMAAVKAASPANVAVAWLSALATNVNSSGRATIRSQPAATQPDASVIKLNLGCGDKILPGYVNVDVVESRAGKSPDVICDLHQLTPFPNNHADEILAVHVVEHFWRWEVEAILREWIRVLKPGGRMVLECPNLQSACEAFLANPTSASGGGNAGQRTMWVFYGDPSWKDPLMVHRWGYTPASLSALMESVGLQDPRQEPAQFKLREPRDMRIVAEKPL